MLTYLKILDKKRKDKLKRRKNKKKRKKPKIAKN